MPVCVCTAKTLPKTNKNSFLSITVESLSSATESVASLTTVVPSFSENRSNPITMTFQTIEPSQLQFPPPRSATPSLVNKPAPMIPHYQQNLVYDYCSAPSSQLFDPSRGTPSPRPDLCKSPAFGPPPNVLKIQAPRLKSSTDSLDLSTKLGSAMAIASGPTCKVLAASSGGFETHSKNVVVQPDRYYREQKGNTNIEMHTSGSQLNEAKKSAMQSSSTMQIGNTQIQRNRRVVEEFEHTQKASTTQIRTSTVGNSGSIQGPPKNCGAITSTATASAMANANANDYFTELSYGKGFVAEQARRLSEGTTPNKNIVASYRFPQTFSEPSDSQFPISNASSFVSFEPPKEQTYHVTTTTSSTAAPNNSLFKQSQIPKGPTNYLSSVKQQQHPYLGGQQLAPSPIAQQPPSPQPSKPQKISFPPPSPFELATTNEPLSNPSPLPLAKACLTKKLPSPYPIITPQSSALSPNPNNRSTFKPTPLNVCGNKATAITSTTTATPTTIFNNQNTVSVSDPNPASAGAANKSGASSLGATFSPKRGRGVLNAGVAPGGRVPLCGCCSAQIR